MNPKLKGSADWHESVDKVLETIDNQLRPYGLQIIQIDTGSDTYEWYVDQLNQET